MGQASKHHVKPGLVSHALIQFMWGIVQPGGELVWFPGFGQTEFLEFPRNFIEVPPFDNGK